MSLLTVPFKRPGDTIESAEQQQVFTDLEGILGASDIAANNIKQGALTTQHFDWSNDPVVADATQMSNGNSVCTLSSTSFESIDQDGTGLTPMEVTVNQTIVSGQVIEVYFSLQAQTPDTSGSDTNDRYRFVVSLDLTGAGDTVIGPRWVYSLQGSDGSSTTASNPDDEIHQNRICGSFYHVWNDTSDIIETAELLGLMSASGNTLVIDDWFLSVGVVKN